MSNNIDLVIEQLTQTAAELKAASDKITEFVLSVPQKIADAVEEARQLGATDEQLAAIGAVQAVFVAEASDLVDALNQVSPPAPEPDPVPEPPVEG